MKNLIDLFKIVKKAPFIENYTELKPGGGVLQRLAGKDTSGKKEAAPTTEELKAVCTGWDNLVKDGNVVIDEIKSQIK